MADRHVRRKAGKWKYPIGTPAQVMGSQLCADYRRRRFAGSRAPPPEIPDGAPRVATGRLEGRGPLPTVPMGILGYFDRGAGRRSRNSKLDMP